MPVPVAGQKDSYDTNSPCAMSFARSPIAIASVPLLTATQYGMTPDSFFVPTYSANSRSNSRTLWPLRNRPEVITPLMAPSMSDRMGSRARVRSWYGTRQTLFMP